MEERARSQIETLRLLAAKRRHERAADALQQVLIAGKHFVFDTVSALFQGQPWALDDAGSLLGHVLTIDDEAFGRATLDCQIEVLPIHEALERTWVDLDERSRWATEYAQGLRALAEQEERRNNALGQIHELLGASSVEKLTEHFPDLDAVVAETRWVVDGRGAIVGLRRMVSDDAWSGAEEGQVGLKTVRCSLETALTQRTWKDDKTRGAFVRAFRRALDVSLVKSGERGAIDDRDRLAAGVPRPQGVAEGGAATCEKCGRPSHAGRCRI